MTTQHRICEVFMSVDPKGTAPGLSPQTKVDQQVIHMKCRNPKCNSITAVEIKIPRSMSRVYRCTDCGYVHTVSVGGAVDL